jgi:hypothetical protein
VFPALCMPKCTTQQRMGSLCAFPKRLLENVEGESTEDNLGQRG